MVGAQPAPPDIPDAPTQQQRRSLPALLAEAAEAFRIGNHRRFELLDEAADLLDAPHFDPAETADALRYLADQYEAATTALWCADCQDRYYAARGAR